MSQRLLSASEIGTLLECERVDVARRAVELREHGCSFTQIGKALGIHRMSAYYWVRQGGQRTYVDRKSGFWTRVEIGDVDACWPWKAGRDGRGYGQVTVDGKKIGAHRRAYELAHGPITAGLVVRHRCDYKPCCNPAHLEIGTFADNSRDAVERGQHWSPRGSLHPRAKFSDVVVARVRDLHAAGLSNLDVADATGVSPSYVSRLVRGQGR